LIVERAHEAGALRSQDLKRVTVDTTVQPKAITFPTDAKLLHAAIKGLNRLARRHGVRLRQSYSRVAKAAAMMAGRYAHAKQFRRHQRQLRILRSRLGRIIRDIRRKIEGQPALEEAFALPLGRATQIRSQQQRQRGWKLYSFHAPEVECIGKGKAAAPYEFGVKASIVTNNRRAPGGLFVLHARALPDNPYDGHTLRDVIDRTDTHRLSDSSGPMSTWGTAATTRKIPVASSSPASSAASSGSSSANCAAAPPSSPSSDT
jgi:transposase, IS5 family